MRSAGKQAAMMCFLAALMLGPVRMVMYVNPGHVPLTDARFAFAPGVEVTIVSGSVVEAAGSSEEWMTRALPTLLMAVTPLPARTNGVRLGAPQFRRHDGDAPRLTNTSFEDSSWCAKASIGDDISSDDAEAGAGEIAEAACAWWRNEDMTVVTVRGGE